MKRSLHFKQTKPLTVKILGAFLFVVSLCFLAAYNAPIGQIVLLILLSGLILGYSISLEATENCLCFRHIKLFGFTVYKENLKIFLPEYITVFSASFKQNADWGSIASLGKETRNIFFVIRFFKGNKHFTVYKNQSYSDVHNRAKELSALLNIEYKSKT